MHQVAETQPTQPKAKRRKVRVPVWPTGPLRLASIQSRTSAEYLKLQKLQRTAPSFGVDEVVLFHRLYEELAMDVRQAKGCVGGRRNT